MDENLNIIFELENNIERLQTENNKYLDANSKIAQQYSYLENQYHGLVISLTIGNDEFLFAY